MAGDEGAGTIYRWLDSMQFSSPQILQIFDEFYRVSPAAAIKAISESLGYDVPQFGGKIEAPGVMGFFHAAGTGEDGESPTEVGQIGISSAWTDPPVPEPDQAFKIVWEEENSGASATGAYQAAILINGDVDQVLDLASLDSGAKAQREAVLKTPLPAGERRVTIYSPWHDDERSTLQTQAGYQSSINLMVAIGAEAALSADEDKAKIEIDNAMGVAVGYLQQLDMEFDTSPIQYALQALASVAPSLDSTLDLMGKANQMMARDPKTVGPEAQASARAKAKDAIVALTAAATRTMLDNASPVDHPDVVKAAELTAGVADVVAASPVVEGAEEG